MNDNEKILGEERWEANCRNITVIRQADYGQGTWGNDECQSPGHCWRHQFAESEK